MNRGAFVFKQNMFNNTEIQELKILADQLYEQKTAVHTEGKYASLKWYQVNLDETLSFVQKLYKELKITTAELCVFYYLEPDAKIHPHRDLTGATLNSRIRFHVPIVTNPNVIFMANNQRVIMNPGDLWCLDTSYLHSVSNGGSDCRVHLIVECEINDHLRNKIPGDLAAKLHSIFYVFILSWQLTKAILLNSIKDPKYLLTQMRMIVKFVRWRVLKIDRAK